MEGWFHGVGMFWRADGMKYEGQFRGGRIWGQGNSRTVARIGVTIKLIQPDKTSLKICLITIRMRNICIYIN